MSPEFNDAITAWSSSPTVDELFRIASENMLLEQRLNERRWNSYSTAFRHPPTDPFDWQAIHREYLRTHIHLSADEFPDVYDPNDSSACPECFTNDMCQLELSNEMVLVHVEKAQYLVGSASSAYRAKYGQALSIGVLSGLLSGYHATRSQEDHDKIALLLTIWRDQRIRRASLAPIFAACWDDLTEQAWSSGCDIRDGLGLTSFSGEPSSPTWMLVWRYPASIIPRKGAECACAAPTLIDFDFYDAFCPTLRERQFGRAVRLGDTAYSTPPVREMIHAVPDWNPEHLFACVAIEKPAPVLRPSRACHLNWIRASQPI